MSFLEKLNPRATRRSVIKWAVVGGIIGAILGLVACMSFDMPAIAGFLILPWMILASAIAAATVEWQLPEDED